MALQILALTGTSAELLAPGAGIRYGTTSMWVYNSDTVTRTVTLSFKNSTTTKVFASFDLGASETKEFPLERVALEGGSDAIWGEASTAGVVNIIISYITLV